MLKPVDFSIVLKRGIYRFQDEDEIKRHTRYRLSYKVNKEHVVYAIRILRSNEQITMGDLNKKLIFKYYLKFT